MEALAVVGGEDGVFDALAFTHGGGEAHQGLVDLEAAEVVQAALAGELLGGGGLQAQDTEGDVLVAAEGVDLVGGEESVEVGEGVLFAQAPREGVAPGDLPVGHAAQGGVAGFEVQLELHDQRAAVVHDGPPDLARFPPAVVGLPDLEGQQDGDRDTQGGGDVDGDVPDAVAQYQRQQVEGRRGDDDDEELELDLVEDVGEGEEFAGDHGGRGVVSRG